MKVNKSLIKRYFKANLSTSEKWAIRGIFVIYGRQTANEVLSQSTSELNSVGFSGCDAEIMSSFCDQVVKGRRLSPKQMAIIFKKMPKYWNQLWDASKNQEATLTAALKWEQNGSSPIVMSEARANNILSIIELKNNQRYREWCDQRGF